MTEKERESEEQRVLVGLPEPRGPRNSGSPSSHATLNRRSRRVALTRGLVLLALALVVVLLLRISLLLLVLFMPLLLEGGHAVSEPGVLRLERVHLALMGSAARLRLVGSSSILQST